ncbi:MAG: hypothetical protein LBR29_06430 [Methylobacteriaceae bacterium]|jgi:adenosine deaminase|nr:hypothetical protein [Methylobacteriaceae bacterium]
MRSTKTILVTTLGASWQVLPELVGWTNPAVYDFFTGNPTVDELRRTCDVTPVDEFWVITTERPGGKTGEPSPPELEQWCKRFAVPVKTFACKGVDDLNTGEKIRTFRSFLFRIVLNASGLTGPDGKLYLSLTGGRKTMSVDMFEAGMLFGCSAMFHIMDINPPPEFRKDDLTGPPGAYARYFLPVCVHKDIPESFLVATGEREITAAAFPFDPSLSGVIAEDGGLEREIRQREQQSAQLYDNFYTGIRNRDGERDIFRKLYFLHPRSLRKLRSVIIGQDPATRERDFEILKALPKADLHVHLGGVLSAEEIIDVARCRKGGLDNGKIKEILGFSDKPAAFDAHIFGDRVKPENYYRIGINPYQALGDYQGSALLQSRETISRTVDIYAANLKADNVRYVEIRCSPYKYTREGLSIDEVVETIMDAMDRSGITYRLICIIGRQSGYDDIRNSIDAVLGLIDRNRRFAEKLAGIDLAGDESANSPARLRELFMPFLKKCIHITIHAGETETADNIWEAVYHLSADRIGHGLKLADREELIPLFIDRNIGIELCPSSNRQIVGYGRPGDAPYPLNDYMTRGLKVTVTTDNPGISRTFVSNEFYEAARLCGGLSLRDCLVLIRNSLIVSFADAKTKLRLLRRFEQDIHEWCVERLDRIAP